MNSGIQTPMECVSRQSETLRINEESDLIKKNEIQFQKQEGNDKIQFQNSNQINENQEKEGEVQSDFQATQNYIQLIKRDQNGQNQRKKRNQLNIQSIQQRYQLKSPQFQRKFCNLGKNISQNQKKINDFPSSKDSQQNLYSEFSNIGVSPQQEIRIFDNFDNGRVFQELKKKKKDLNLFNCNNLIRDYSQRELNFSSPTKSAQFRGLKRKASSKMWYSNQYRPFKLDVEVQRAMQKHIEKYRIYQSNVEKIQDRANPSGNQVYYFSLSKLLCNSILICHVVGTLYFFLAVLEIKYDQEEQAWIKVYDIENASTFKQYSESFYWALATVSLIGSKGETTAETVYCIFVLSCTIGVFATILSKISMAWEQIEKKSRDYKLDREIINQFFKINNISNDLQGQLHNYLKHQYEGHSTQNVNNMFEQLVEKFPVELQELVKKERYDQQIRKISFLSKNFQNKTLEQISYLAQEEYFMPNQIIFQWQKKLLKLNQQLKRIQFCFKKQNFFREKPTAPKIYLVLQGEANLKQGEYFGHDTFFTNENPLYSARSNPNSFLTLLSISREDFLQVLKSHGNEEDFEKFHYFKDSILINGFCRQMDINCYICEDNTHRENNCNLLNYIPNRNIMLNRINYANCLEQDRFSYQRKYHQKFGLVKMQSLYAISQKIIYNPDLRKYLQEFNQTLDDIVSQMSSEISSDKYDSMQEYSYDYNDQEDNQQMISQFNQNQKNKQKKPFLKDSQSSFSQIQSENSIEFNIRINMEQQDQVQKSQSKNNLKDSSDNSNEIGRQKMGDIELSQQLQKQQKKNKQKYQQFNQRNQDQIQKNQIFPQNKNETQDDILDLVEFYTNSVEFKNKIEQFIENKEDFQKFQAQSEIKMSSDQQSQIEKQYMMKDNDDNKNKSQNQNQIKIFDNQEEKIIENNEKIVNIFSNEKESTRNSKCSINQQDFQENSNNCLKRKESLIDKLDYLGNSRQKFIIKQGSLQNQNNQHFMSQTNCTYNRLGSNNQNNMMLISNFNQENDDNFNRSQENNKIQNQEQNEEQVKKLKQQQQNKYQQVSPVQESIQSQIKSSIKESQITNEYDSLRKKKQSICNQRKSQVNNLQILNKNIEQIFEKKIRNSGQIPSLTSDEKRNSVANNKRKQKKMRNRNKSQIQNSLKGEQQSEFEENFINNNIKQKNIQQRQSLNNNYICNGQKIKIQNKNNLQPSLQQVIKNPTLNQFYNSNQRQNSIQNQSQIQTYTSFQGDLKSRRNGLIPNNNNNDNNINNQGIQQSENLVINQVFSQLKEIQQILKKNMQFDETKEEQCDRFIEDDVGNFMLKNNIDLGGINYFGGFEGILEFQILPDFDFSNKKVRNRMSKLLKEILSLSKGVEASQWAAVEGQLLKQMNTLSASEFSQAVKHFGEQQAGSQELWRKFDFQTKQIAGNFVPNEMLNVFHGFGSAEYKPSKDLNTLLVRSWDALGQYYVNQENEKDPYFLQKKLNTIEASLPPQLKNQIRERSESQEVIISDFQPELDGQKKLVLSEENAELYNEWKQTVQSNQEGQRKYPGAFSLNLSDFLSFK
ncbi:Cyclic nucleotide-binding protein [Pseudocohnilembus persalinus]|uniref:Cyclic nucleotide-binding protein n=1 Tax=Pseudocohnilembus persalinus TaxID=266149 RepID=A0A0V0R8R8_PSEPJ|nr:Cyclic nucleotide-binding protein [Pseudocohnilembus persalinus]|eukprot:KRX10867.1 Cyclic nucleotide-binding protein [Pseudocohnilembus persalinus]